MGRECTIRTVLTASQRRSSLASHSCVNEWYHGMTKESSKITQRFSVRFPHGSHCHVPRLKSRQSRQIQIPSDLVVKPQPIDNTEFILARIRRLHVVQTLCSNRKSRCELLSISEAHWVVYLCAADKSPRLTRRPSQGQKSGDQRAIMTSRRPSAPC